MTLFDKYGGVPAVTSIVKSFYKEVLANPRLKIYFEKSNSDKLIQHQIVFISQLLGKPTNEKLNAHDTLKRVHTGKRIAESAFKEVKETLEAVLIAHKLEASDVAAVMAIIQGFQGAIVELPTIVRTA
jgi:hemoglobin